MIMRPETLCGGIMQRLSLSFFYDLGANLRRLKDFQVGETRASVWGHFYAAETSLDGLLRTYWMSPAVRSSWALGNELQQTILATRTQGDLAGTLTELEIAKIHGAISAFEPVLRADLSIADAYYVTRKGGYDTITLITNAEALFPEAIRTKVQSAIPEIQEAGKCLAFELCTASGIHIMRALEVVLKAYFKAVTKGEPLPKNRNIGAYLKKLEGGGYGDKKTIAALTQIKDLHRNPLVHPDETLTKDEAIGLWGIVISATGAMLKAIPVAPVTPLAATLAALPPFEEPPS
jgi:hypothetical protein